jgi:hypothetical protein
MTMRSMKGVVSTIPVLFGAGCQADDEGGFRITNVEFDGDSTIILTFSEPVASIAGIDPNDFRLSHASTSSYTYTYGGMSMTSAYTSYRDVSFDLGGYYYYNTERFILMEVVQGSAANQIVLRASESLMPACDEINEDLAEFELYGQMYNPGARFDTALFLHYASGDVPIESQAGGLLGDIGADWVRSDDLSIGREGFGFTQLAPQLRIPCD